MRVLRSLIPWYVAACYGYGGCHVEKMGERNNMKFVPRSALLL